MSPLEVRHPWTHEARAVSVIGREVRAETRRRRYSLFPLRLGELDVGAVQLLPQRLARSGLLPLQQQCRTTQVDLVQVGPLVVPLPLQLHPLEEKKEKEGGQSEEASA